MQVGFEHYGAQSGRRLFLLIHGMEHSAADLSELREAIEAGFPGDRILAVTYPSSRWSNANPIEISRQCIAEIQAEFKKCDQGGYEEILLVGHSLGALLARKICLLAHGICSDFAVDIPVKPVSQPWANNITRLVLLAGMSRGWRLRPRNRHTSRVRWAARGAQLAVARAGGRGRLVRAVHRGSPFIVNLRLDWLALVNGDYKGQVPPEFVVQLAGLHDTVVHPSDHIDLQAGGNFKYFEIAGTSHQAMVRFDDPEHGPERKRAFMHALQLDPDTYSGCLIPEGNAPDFTVSQTILLTHGIRDYGKWPEDLSEQLDAGAVARNIRIETSITNYDYLALLPFLFGIRRTVHVERFMDRYAEMRSQFPNATCSFIGHSNGTYILASALRRYHASRFERVALMGSIVQRNFPWLSQFRHRVGKVRNYVASADEVVAIFPSLFEMIRRVPLLHSFSLNRDFGSAGHTGFVQVNDDIRNVTYVKGGHGAGLEARYRDALVSFLLGDAPAQQIGPQVIDEQSGLVILAHKACVVLWIGMLAASALVLYGSVLANTMLGWKYPVLPLIVIISYLFLFFRF